MITKSSVRAEDQPTEVITTVGDPWICPNCFNIVAPGQCDQETAQEALHRHEERCPNWKPVKMVRPTRPLSVQAGLDQRIGRPLASDEADSRPENSNRKILNNKKSILWNLGIDHKSKRLEEEAKRPDECGLNSLRTGHPLPKRKAPQERSVLPSVSLLAQPKMKTMRRRLRQLWPCVSGVDWDIVQRFIERRPEVHVYGSANPEACFCVAEIRTSQLFLMHSFRPGQHAIMGPITAWDHRPGSLKGHVAKGDLGAKVRRWVESELAKGTLWVEEEITNGSLNKTAGTVIADNRKSDGRAGPLKKGSNNGSPAPLHYGSGVRFPIPAISVDWEILARWTCRELVERLEASSTSDRSRIGSGAHQRDPGRLERLSELNPDFAIFGKTGWRGYCGFVFVKNDRIVFDCSLYGNAIYVAKYVGWERLARVTKVEGRRLGVYKRIYHSAQWLDAVRAHLNDVW